MNDRQRYALEHPLDRAADPLALERLRTVHHVGNGELLTTILAVDR